MKVEVIVNGKPYRSLPVGASLYLTPVEAKVLVALKRVTYKAEDAEPVEVPVVEDAPKPRRTYRTRAMKAE